MQPTPHLRLDCESGKWFDRRNWYRRGASGEARLMLDVRQEISKKTHSCVSL